MAPTPPAPLIHGSTTPTAHAAAVAASTALPPSRSISTPASAARRCPADTMPALVSASAFDMSQRDARIERSSLVMMSSRSTMSSVSGSPCVRSQCAAHGGYGRPSPGARCSMPAHLAGRPARLTSRQARPRVPLSIGSSMMRKASGRPRRRVVSTRRPRHEEMIMSDQTRRQFLTGTMAAGATLALSAPYVRAQKRGGTLRFVPHADLRVLDVTRYTGYITNRTNGYLVYDTLFSLDAAGNVKPQMADRYTASKDGRKWSFTLRDGLKFHDGQPVTAEDCVVSLKRWSQRDPLGQFFIAATERLQATGTKTFVLELGKPFGLVLESLAKPSAVVPFILPARLAATPEEEMIKEAIGSGPYKFVKEEWQPGNQVVYIRNADYVPRNEN